MPFLAGALALSEKINKSVSLAELLGKAGSTLTSDPEKHSGYLGNALSPFLAVGLRPDLLFVATVESLTKESQFTLVGKHIPTCTREGWNWGLFSKLYSVER